MRCFFAKKKKILNPPDCVIVSESGSTAIPPRLPLRTAFTRLRVTFVPRSSAISRVNVKLNRTITLPRLQWQNRLISNRMGTAVDDGKTRGKN